jgi:hypothetical protein
VWISFFVILMAKMSLIGKHPLAKTRIQNGRVRVTLDLNGQKGIPSREALEGWRGEGCIKIGFNDARLLGSEVGFNKVVEQRKTSTTEPLCPRAI